MTKPSLYICTPTHQGKPDVNYTASLMMTVQKLIEARIPYEVNFLVGATIDAARSTQATRFLESDCTHMLMIDDDLAWSADLPQRLLAMDVDIVGVPYRKKMAKDVKYTLSHGTQVRRHADHKNMIIVDGLATGFMMVRRNVFEKMMIDTPKVQRSPGHEIYMFFRHEIMRDPTQDNRLCLIGEDYTFCSSAIAHGFDIWAYIDEDLPHIGKYAFRGAYSGVVGDDFKADVQREAVRVIVD